MYFPYQLTSRDSYAAIVPRFFVHSIFTTENGPLSQRNLARNSLRVFETRSRGSAFQKQTRSNRVVCKQHHSPLTERKITPSVKGALIRYHIPITLKNVLRDV